jgi:hypothetical protein
MTTRLNKQNLAGRGTAELVRAVEAAIERPAQPAPEVRRDSVVKALFMRGRGAGSKA